MASNTFLFVTCQVGAEPAIKRDVAERHHELRFAYSRPGFLTFKLPPDRQFRPDFRVESAFARAQGISLGRATSGNLEDRAREVVALAGDQPYAALHVWPRDRWTPGHRGFTPGLNEESKQARAAIFAKWPADDPRRVALEGLSPARAGRLVLDCIVVGPTEWWVGFHQAQDEPSRFPGGLRDTTLPPHAVSRAYLKMTEALDWAQFPLQPGQQAVEIGCAPGGAAQALLERELSVVGIDPADVDPVVAEHPRFTHVRKRGAEVRRREFRKTRWLVADMNVAPQYTLDTVEGIVTHAEVDVRGLLLTLKLLDWDLAAMLPEYLERIRSWGYDLVRARQLQFNRQEVCVAALRGGRVRLTKMNRSATAQDSRARRVNVAKSGKRRRPE